MLLVEQPFAPGLSANLFSYNEENGGMSCQATYPCQIVFYTIVSSMLEERSLCNEVSISIIFSQHSLYFDFIP